MVSENKVRVTVTLSKDVYTKVKAAAEKDQRSISSWLSIAAAEKLKNDSKKAK